MGHAVLDSVIIKIHLPGGRGCITVVNVVRGDAHLGRLARFNSWVLHHERPGQPWVGCTLIPAALPGA